MVDDISPQEKLKQLSELIEEKEKEEEELEKEIDEAKKEVAKELAELDREELIKEVSNRIARLESQGRTDDQIISQLENLGVSLGAISSALRLHNLHCEEDHHIPLPAESIDEILEGEKAKPVEENVFYNLRDQMMDGMDIYDTASKEMYDTLQQMRDTVQARGGVMTQNEYNVLRMAEDHLREKQEMYNDQSTYLQRESAVIESIKGMGLKIGDSYLQNNDWDV